MESWRYEFLTTKAAHGLVFASRSYYERVVSTIGDGEPVIVTLSKPQDKRSLQQNKALWGPIYDQLIDGICRNQGIALGDRKSKELMHEGLLQAFGGTVIDPVTKREVTKERSSDMTVERFGEFMEFIAVYAAQEHNVIITLPGER